MHFTVTQVFKLRNCTRGEGLLLILVVCFSLSDDSSVRSVIYFDWLKRDPSFPSLLPASRMAICSISMNKIIVIGGGLAGVEAAWQAANAGARVQFVRDASA